MSTASDTSGVRLFPPGVYIGGLIIGYAVQWLLPVRILPPALDPAGRILGIALLLAGGGLMFSALALFRSVGTTPNPTQPTTALTFDGPYRFTRNPMYLGMALLLVGFSFVGNALWPLLTIIPAVWIIQTQVILREEPYLEAKFGAPYIDYKKRVRRWL